MQVKIKVNVFLLYIQMKLEDEAHSARSTHSFRRHMALYHNVACLHHYRAMISLIWTHLRESPLSAIHHNEWNNKLSGFPFAI